MVTRGTKCFPLNSVCHPLGTTTRFVRFSEHILFITRAKCHSVLQLLLNFINEQCARIAQSVRDYTIERTAARQTQKEVLHYVQTGYGAGQPQIR
jgi:hypothetical protein